MSSCRSIWHKRRCWVRPVLVSRPCRLFPGVPPGQPCLTRVEGREVLLHPDRPYRPWGPRSISPARSRPRTAQEKQERASVPRRNISFHRAQDERTNRKTDHRGQHPPIGAVEPRFPCLEGVVFPAIPFASHSVGLQAWTPSTQSRHNCSGNCQQRRGRRLALSQLAEGRPRNAVTNEAVTTRGSNHVQRVRHSPMIAPHTAKSRLGSDELS